MTPVLAKLALVLLAGILVTLPLLPALLELHLKRDAQPLIVLRQHANEIRHFAYGFRECIEPLLGALRDCVASRTTVKGVMAGGDEYVLLGCSSGDLPDLTGNPANCQSVLLAGVDFIAPNEATFSKELYAAENFYGGERNTFRAVLGEKDVHLAQRSTVTRWAHAVSTFRADSDCDLHGRISADSEIQLGAGCSFQRLNAPHISFGNSNRAVSDDAAHVDRAPLPRSRELMDEDLNIPPGDVVAANIVTRGKLRIGTAARLLGSAKSDQELSVGERVLVEGSLVSASTMRVGRDCRINGPLIAERGMRIAAGTSCGSAGRPTTVSAPVIDMEAGTIVFGTVWARLHGKVVAKL
jgi:hypothetical protein